MYIDELIQKLADIKIVHGNLEVVGADDYDIDYVEVQKYIMTNNDYNSIIDRQTEDLNENYLEDMYVKGNYKHRFVSSGICLKIY